MELPCLVIYRYYDSFHQYVHMNFLHVYDNWYHVFYKILGCNRKPLLSSYFVDIFHKRVPLSCNTDGSTSELIKTNVSNQQTYSIMTKNGKKILEFLENFQYESSV
ncbi:MAG: hypothetical protein ACE5RG_09145, partial [Candidatus Nitrosomaritimum yanchengensis]